MQHLHYWQFPGFENIYLEDSYVLGIESKNASLQILLECVLTEQHPLYSQPLSGEAYCYRQMKIKFPQVKSDNLNSLKMRAIPNPDGRSDFGNIDEFFMADGKYHLFGEWGEIIIISDSPELVVDSILVKNGENEIQIDKDKIQAVEWKSDGEIKLVYEDDSGNPLSAQIEQSKDAAAFAAALAYLGELQGGFVTHFTDRITERIFSKV